MIEDAKFDTVTNAEFEKLEELSCQPETPETLAEDEAVENGGVHVVPEDAVENFQFSLIVALRDMKDFSRVFKLLEVGCFTLDVSDIYIV